MFAGFESIRKWLLSQRSPRTRPSFQAVVTGLNTLFRRADCYSHRRKKTQPSYLHFSLTPGGREGVVVLLRGES